MENCCCLQIRSEKVQLLRTIAILEYINGGKQLLRLFFKQVYMLILVSTVAINLYNLIV
uniref:Uncharacterized protein n=1 Tax=Anguilla anguilla TaxID=7936 RepID=A0A0E9WTK1_ANGAN